MDNKIFIATDRNIDMRLCSNVLIRKKLALICWLLIIGMLDRFQHFLNDFSLNDVYSKNKTGLYYRAIIDAYLC